VQPWPAGQGEILTSMASNGTGSRLLVVDDDPDLRHFLMQELVIEGYTCQEAASVAEALTHLRAQSFDLVLLDWGLPDFSGVELCRRLRQTLNPTPVLMLTAHDDVQERVEALDAGADDYLTKPFSLEELLARIRARLRRALPAPGQAEVLKVADLSLNVASYEVRRGNETINLTTKEFDLLCVLIREPERVHSRGEILQAVWGEHWVGDDNILDVYIRALRRKIERAGAPTLIQTVRGVGFMLRAGDLKC
jgi:two-component system, OmpR family, response regulator MprA